MQNISLEDRTIKYDSAEERLNDLEQIAAEEELQYQALPDDGSLKKKQDD